MIYVIGAGGGGSWLTPALCLLTEPKQVTVIDGDKLEKKNLNRQLFTEEHIGRYKAEALANVYKCKHLSDWYNCGIIEHDESDWIFSCVDNHPARCSILKACDRYGCRAIIAANEMFSSEAYVYLPEWRDTKHDPRIIDPAMLTDVDGDPQRAAIGCTGEVQRANRQLVSANFMAVGLAQHLYVAWAMEFPKLDKALLPHMPRKMIANLSALETIKVGE